MLYLNVVLWLQYYVHYVGPMYVLTRCREFPFPATRGHVRSEPEVAARGRYYYTSKERLHNQNEVAYCINNNVILFHTEHGFIKNKNIASCSSKNSANSIHYWSYRDVK